MLGGTHVAVKKAAAFAADPAGFPAFYQPLRDYRSAGRQRFAGLAPQAVVA